MLSWHKVGQKVVALPPHPWRDGVPGRAPAYGEVCTVSEVCLVSGFEAFCLREYPQSESYPRWCFRPVYPQQIEELKKLTENLPTPDPGEIIIGDPLHA